MSTYEFDPVAKDDIEAFINEADGPVTKRDIANNLGIKGQGRIPMKRALKELVSEGRIRQNKGNLYEKVDHSEAPSVCTLAVSEITVDGDIMARPVDDGFEHSWAEGVQIEVNVAAAAKSKKPMRAPGLGDKVLAKIFYVHEHLYYAEVIKVLGRPKPSILGRLAVDSQGVWYVEPVDRKEKDDYVLSDADMSAFPKGKPQEGFLVEVQPLPQKGFGVPHAKLLKVIGHDDDPRAISIIAIHEYGLREEFPADVIDETEGLKVPPLGKREDLRHIPLVTIDGADARDFDDAVFAEKDTDPQNSGGYHLLVAIADVSYYVRSGSALDREAFKRGNSTYFPDRVVPMLPEALSNDLCSLRPKENRACMAMHMWIDKDGNLLRFKPVRGLMRSAARLVYEQVQAAIEGVTDEITDGLVEPVLKPLYDVFKILARAREKRGALDIEMPERQVIIDDKGNMSGVKSRIRLDAHRLIEEFMILANVAAAMALEKKKSPCIYRVHGRPSEEKVDNARTFLDSLGYSLPKGQVIKPHNLNAILHKARDTDVAHIVNEIVLRSQAQAVYTPENEGHFGLGLQKYAHFTSPIRRYADLIVHRSMVRAYGFGEGALDDGEDARLAEIADSISKTERFSMEAERSSIDRFTASWMVQHKGNSYDARISGVSRFGLFVRLNENGAEGLVPIRTLPNDYYIHDEQQHALIGRRNRVVFRLCAPLRVRIVQADRLTGSATFEVLNANKGADIPGFKAPKPHYRSGKHAGRLGGKGKPKPKPKSHSGSSDGGKGGSATPQKPRKKTTPKHKKKAGRPKGK